MALQELRAREDTIRACGSFEELHNLIKSTLESISGLGELYCYDLGYCVLVQNSIFTLKQSSFMPEQGKVPRLSQV